MNLTGKCLCGSVSYECEEAPLMSGCCHCDDCQRQTGSAFAPLLVFPKESVSFSGADLREYVAHGASGKAVKRGFCSNCGGSVYAWYEVTPDYMVIMAGTADDKSKFNPDWDIYTDGAQPWIEYPEGHKVYPQGYGSGQ